jgi:arylamine N-acetyltransferase
VEATVSLHAKTISVFGLCRDVRVSPDVTPVAFTKARICSRLTPRERITLSEMLFITTEGGARRERPVASQEEYADILRKDFGIVTK